MIGQGAMPRMATPCCRVWLPQSCLVMTIGGQLGDLNSSLTWATFPLICPQVSLLSLARRRRTTPGLPWQRCWVTRFGSSCRSLSFVTAWFIQSQTTAANWGSILRYVPGPVDLNKVVLGKLLTLSPIHTICNFDLPFRAVVRMTPRQYLRGILNP